MGEDPRTPPEGDQASQLFAAFLGRVEAGEEVDFAAFCAEHRDVEHELQLLHRDWLQLRHVLSRLGLSASLTERIREEYGEEVAPEAVFLDGQAPEIEATDRGRSTRRYQAHGSLGRGGQGEVLLVWDDNLKRKLAMKVARSQSGGAVDSRALARFLEEAQVTGQLDHPGIVPIHDLGLDPRGHLYFTMKLVKGRDLNEIFELARRGDEGWTRTRVLSTLLRVCEAMAYAHSKGVVHRDLKPANIMVGKFGEVYVMDWGLARILGAKDTKDIRIREPEASPPQHPDSVELLSARRKDDTSSPFATMDGDVLGTPAYMAPEQARGELQAIGPASDVYSLGAILYHTLAGRAPFTDRAPSKEPLDHLAILNRLRDAPPTPVARVATNAPAPLVAVCEKAMARRASERYATTGEFADDLRAFLENRVVQAFETGPWAEARTWVRRNSALASWIGLALLLAVAGVGGAIWLQASATRTAEFQEYAAKVSLAHRAAQALNAPEARRLLDSTSQALGGWERAHVELESDLSTWVLRGHTEEIRCVAIAPGLRYIASGGADGRALVWDRDAATVHRSNELGAAVLSVAFTADGRHLVAGTRDGRVHVLARDSGERVARLGPLGNEVRTLDCAPSDRIAVGCLDGTITIWHPPWTPTSTRSLSPPLSLLDAVHTVRFLDEEIRGADFMSVSRAAARLWNMESGKAKTVAHSTQLAICVNQGIAAWRSPEKDAIQWYDLRAGARKTVSQREAGTSALAMDNEGTLLAVGRKNGLIALWDPQRNVELRQLAGHEAAISCLQLAPDGSLLVSGSLDRTLRVWERGVTSSQVIKLGNWRLVHAQFLEGNRLALLSAEGRWIELDARTGELLDDRKHDTFIPTYETNDAYGQPEIVHGPSVCTRDGSTLLLGNRDGTVRAVDVQSAEAAEFALHGSPVDALALHPDERHIATGCRDGRIQIWPWPHMENGKILQRTGTAVSALNFSPDGEQLICVSLDGQVRVLDAASGRLIKKWQTDFGRTRDVLIERNGRLLTAEGDGQLRLWSLERGESLLTLRASASDPSPTVSIDCSQDGSRIVMGTELGTVVVFETDAHSASRWNASWKVEPLELTQSPKDIDLGQDVADATVGPLVDRLFDKLLFTELVLERLDGLGLDEASKRAANRLVRDRVPLSPRELIDAAWKKCRDAEASPSAYELGLQAARKACESQPGAPWFRVVLGISELRAREDLPGAIATLTRALDLFIEAETPEEAIGRAFLASALSKEGRHEEADRQLEAARTIALHSDSQQAKAVIQEISDQRH